MLSLGLGCAPDARAPAGGAISFDAIYENIFDVVGCTAAFCHAGGVGLGGLDLEGREHAYASLVGVPAAGEACRASGLPRVAPGDPEGSLLFLKLAGRAPCGLAMPPGAPLAADQIARVRRWIEDGARRP